MDISTVDRNFAIQPTVTKEDIVWHDIKEPAFDIYGLYDPKNTYPYYRLPPEIAAQAVKDYRTCFVAEGMWENRVYDGIPALLADLRAHGYRMVIATSKPEPFAVKILEHFALLPYFDRVCGASLDEKRSTKSDVIAYTLSECGITDVRDALMIGDRHHDVDGAHDHGLRAIGVLWGYGDRAEHEAALAEYIVQSIDELRVLLTENIPAS